MLDDNDNNDELLLRIGSLAKDINLINSQNHCQRFSPSQICDTMKTGLEAVYNLSTGFVE